MTEVFLMGTAGASHWREPLKAAFDANGITYYDPIVPVWDEEARRREADALQRAAVVVMAITDETPSIGSLAESGWAALSALQRGQAFGLYVDPAHAEKEITSTNVTGWLIDTLLGGRDRVDEEVAGGKRARKLVSSHAARLQLQFPDLNLYLATSLDDLQTWAISAAKRARGHTVHQVTQPREAVLESFVRRFGHPPTLIARAPGRVNVIGEHTDYNDGFVLPAAIDKAIYIAGRLREDDLVTIHSLDFNTEATFTLARLRDEKLPSWTRYPRGALALTGTLFVMNGRNPAQLRGVEITIAGDVPLGAGFSSSAAVEVAMFELIAGLYDLPITGPQKALLGQQVEHLLIGIRSGIMDQMISAVGQAGHALLIDCRSLATQAVPLPKGVTLVTLDTGKRRELVTSEYGKRREQCEEACRILRVPALRDATIEMLTARRAEMPEVVYMRAKHVIEENARTLACVEALKAGDMMTVGRLLNESHASLRDLYAVSIQELDIMADLAQGQPGIYGARMMGGGFGGACIALVDDGAVDHAVEQVIRAYETATGLNATAYTAKAGAGSSAERIGA